MSVFDTSKKMRLIIGKTVRPPKLVVGFLEGKAHIPKKMEIVEDFDEQNKTTTTTTTNL